MKTFPTWVRPWQVLLCALILALLATILLNKDPAGATVVLYQGF
jgi:hypothetical protein